MRKFPIEVEGIQFTVAITRYEYASTGGDAYLLTEAKDSGELGDPFATMTVNLGEVADGCCFVDSNSPCDFEKFIEDNGLGKRLGQMVESGFRVYSLYKMRDELADLGVGETL